MSLGKEYENITMEQIRPPFAFLYALLILGSIFFSIFQKLDSDRLFFTGCLVIAGVLSAYYLQYARKIKATLQGASIVFFVIVWLGIHSFSNQQDVIDFSKLSINFSLLKVQIHYLANRYISILQFLQYLILLH